MTRHRQAPTRPVGCAWVADGRAAGAGRDLRSENRLRYSRLVDLPPHPPYRPGMDRRCFLLTSVAAALAAPLAAEAQAGKVARIGYMMLSPLTDPPSPERAAGY